MYNQTVPNDSRNDIRSSPELKIPNPVNIVSFLEEGNLQKCFFSGQITIEEYQRKKKMLKMV
jgi:hypothetical protein